MARYFALATPLPRWPQRSFCEEAFRGAVVIGCALALIAAGNALPF